MTIKKNKKSKKLKKPRKPLPPFSESVWRSRILYEDPLAAERIPVRRIRYEKEIDTDPMTDPNAITKYQAGIHEYVQDIRQMSRKELLTHFCFKTKENKINVTLLLKNLIWQTYTWIKQGKLPSIDGNIRSFWYQSVKPVLSRLGFKLTGTKYTEAVYDTFVEMVIKLKLLHYADFGFIDERNHARVIGRTNGHLILFVEKDGLYSLVRKLALEYDTTAIALGGFPSYLTTEFLVNDLLKMGLKKKSVRLFSIVDYDPSGYWIEHEFAQQLKDLDLAVASVHSLVNPKELPGELLEACKYKLPKGKKTKNWLEATGGIAGETFGLEADALGHSRLRVAYEKAISPYFKGITKEKMDSNILRCSSCGSLISLEKEKNGERRNAKLKQD